jgi:hypothetical protein
MIHNNGFTIHSEDRAPYFWFSPGHFTWDIHRRIDRELYAHFLNDDTLFIFEEQHTHFIAILGDEGYVLLRYNESNH